MIPSEIIKEKLYNEGGVYVACEEHLSGKEGSECILDEQDIHSYCFKEGNGSSESFSAFPSLITDLIKYTICAESASIT